MCIISQGVSALDGDRVLIVSYILGEGGILDVTGVVFVLYGYVVVGRGCYIF
jgi:hypothetical protein